MKKVAVIGFPVKHSLSPKLHGYWIKEHNLEAQYNALEIDKENFNRDTLNKYIDDGYVGFNITIPHKEGALKIVDEVSDRAKKIGAVNTIYLQDGKLVGTNTDAYGFIENIKQNSNKFDFNDKTAILLGAGGASRAIIYGLLNEGVNKIIICNRTYENAVKMQGEFGDKVLAEKWENRNPYISQADILINSTSLGMQGQRELDIDVKSLKKSALVTDIVYKPLHTKLLKNADANGNITVDGLGMLLYQAIGGFKYWFDIEPKVSDNLRKYILSL